MIINYYRRRATRMDKMDDVPDAQELYAVFPHLEAIDTMPSPRVIKSHLPFYLLPPNFLDTCKVVYVARNPKDVIVSFYYHHKLMKMEGFSGAVDCFADYFMKDQGTTVAILLALLKCTFTLWLIQYIKMLIFTFIFFVFHQ